MKIVAKWNYRRGIYGKARSIKKTLIEAQKLSMQGSMDRRAPAKKAVPFLIKPRQGLKDYVKGNGTDPLARRLL
jgi:hypothetical protein